MEHGIPEPVQRLGEFILEVRHEVAEQDGEEDQTQHLAFHGGLEDILRHHAQENLRDVADAPPLHLRRDFLDRSVQCEQVLGWLTVDVARPDHIDQQQSHEDRGKRRRRIEQQSLAAERAEVTARAYAGNADNNRRGNQRHDDHLQRVEKNRADIVEDGEITDAEQRRLDAGGLEAVEDDPANDRSKDDGDQDLPVQFELGHTSPVRGWLLL